MKVEPVIIRQMVEDYLSQPKNVSQFTVDWAERKSEEIEESTLNTGTLLLALCYEVETILEIMDEAIADWPWFRQLKEWLEQVPKDDTSGADGWETQIA